MVLPGTKVDLRNDPLVLTGDQVRSLNEQLSKMRHDINNNLTVLVAAIDLIRYKPDSLDKWLASIRDQPGHINSSLREFSRLFEETLGISRPPADHGPHTPGWPKL